MVHSGGGGGALKVMYTNIDGLLSGILELRDYLTERKPDVVCITETKLREEIQISFKQQGYNVWRRDRKGRAGGGVLTPSTRGLLYCVLLPPVIFPLSYNNKLKTASSIYQ